MEIRRFLKLFPFILVCQVAFTQDRTYCLESFGPSQDGDLAYSERGGRCEGFYVQKVSSTDIALVSMVSQTVTDFSKTNTLLVTWPVPLGAVTELRLQAQGVRDRLFYRMDTENPVIPSEFSWDTYILKKAKITPDDIGVLGWTDFPQGKVYTPIGLSNLAVTAPDSFTNYTLRFIPSSKLEEVYLGVGFVGAAANDLKIFDIETVNTQALGYGSYSAGIPFSYTISLDNLTETGFYLIRLQALSEDGLPITDEWLFFHDINL